jgi:signal transduction histidine kinase
MTYTASQRFLQRLSCHLACVVIAIGVLVVSGWLLNLPVLKSISPRFVAMNPLTAIFLILGGLTLRRLAMRPADWFIRVFALIIVLVNAAKLGQYFFGLDFNLDQLLFHAGTSPAPNFPANEIAPNTALTFFLCGLGLLLMDVETRRGFRPAQALFLSAAFIVLVALIGYAYSVLPLYSIGSAIPMALNTAIAFALFCLAGLSARPASGMMRIITSNTTGGAMARRLLPAAILIPFLLGALRLFGERKDYFDIKFGASLFAVANTVIFTALIWINAKLLFIAEHEKARAERRLAAQYAVTRALAEFPADAARKVLETFGSTVEWQFGALWSVDEKANVLRCQTTWHADDADVADFESKTCRRVLNRGEGLAGRVWNSGQPEWIEDVTRDKNFSRVPIAVKAGLHGALAFPLQFDTTTFGVMEFFSRDVELRDESLLQTVGAIGSQIGQFIERRRAEDQLKQTTAELERSNTELQQFAYVASHDLTEPLRMVVSYLQLLADRNQSKLDAESQEFIGYAVDGAKRMQALINDLLAYARVDIRGRQFEPTNCEDALLVALANLKIAIQESNATIEHESLPTVNGDRIQLTQIFQNLIGNALKFRGDTPLRIQISAKRNGGEWIFQVKDNGIGIETKNFARIFVLFQRLHTRQEYAGTGMGLAICKKIIERHGGRIWVESAPGEGSTFFFTLPVLNEANPK